jgi:hypothetical protein
MAKNEHAWKWMDEYGMSHLYLETIKSNHKPFQVVSVVEEQKVYVYL